MGKEGQTEFEKKVVGQFMSGKNLFGKGGAFAPMLKNVIEKALETEMEGYLDHSQHGKGNKRNDKGKKTIKSGFGTFDIDTPQDRQSSFEPERVKKRQTILADNLSEKIMGLYSLDMSYRDISSPIKEMYDTDISHTVPSQITDKIIPDVILSVFPKAQVQSCIKYATRSNTLLVKTKRSSCEIQPGLCNRVRDEALTHNKPSSLVSKAWHRYGGKANKAKRLIRSGSRT